MSGNAKTDPRHDFLPAREADLLAWSRNFRDQINLSPQQFGLSGPQAAHYATVHDAFAAAFARAHNPGTSE